MTWLAAWGGLALYVAFTVHLCLLGLVYPYQLDYGEGLMLHQALTLARGQSIYKPIDSYPYIFSNYTPLMQAVVSPCVAVLGPSFLPGRLLGTLATLGLALLLYRLVRQAGAPGPAAPAAALLFAGSPYVYHWAPLFRTDLPALFLSVLGMTILFSACRDTERALQPSPDRCLSVAALLFVLAVYTKQSYVAAPLVGFTYLALQDRAAAWRFLAALIVLGLVPFAVINTLTNGAFAFGLFTANVNPFSLSLLAAQVADFAKTFAVVILLALVGAVATIHRARACSDNARCPLRLLLLYLAAATATILLAGKVGAWENYFFEALFMLCVFAGLGIARLMTGPRLVRMIVPLGLIVQLVLMWHDPRIGQRVVDEDGAANRVLTPLIAQQTGPILSEDLGLLLVNGQEIPYFSFQYTQLALVGRWDQQWEMEALAERRFSLVVLEKGTREDPDRYQRFTRAVLSQIDANYGLVAEVGKYRVYAPLPMQRRLDVAFGDEITLLGYRLDEATDLGRGDLSRIGADSPRLSLNPYPPRIRVTLLWQARRTMTTDYKVAVHLVDLLGPVRAQADAMPLFNLYPTSRWAAGEIVRDYLDLTIPPCLGERPHFLRVGLYDPVTHMPVKRAGGSTDHVLAALPLGLDMSAVQPQNPLAAGFAGDIELRGYDLAGASVSPPTLTAGRTLTVTLHWRADAYVDRDYNVFLHLVRDTTGPPPAQADGPPMGGGYPTSLWNPGDHITDSHVLATPKDLPPGTYRLLVGMYFLPTGERLAVRGGGDHVTLTTVTVTQP